jgi:hypothetical protein
LNLQSKTWQTVMLLLALVLALVLARVPALALALALALVPARVLPKRGHHSRRPTGAHEAVVRWHAWSIWCGVWAIGKMKAAARPL